MEQMSTGGRIVAQRKISSANLEALFWANIGKRIAILAQSFPFFMTGVIKRVNSDNVFVKLQEGVPIELAGLTFALSFRNLAAFFIEDREHPIPSLGALTPEEAHPPYSEPAAEIPYFGRDDSLRTLKGKDVLFVLLPSSLSILGQVFRPILVARMKEIGCDFILVDNVNLRMSNAPDFVFPLPLYIPTRQIAAYTPFDRKVFFSLT